MPPYQRKHNRNLKLGKDYKERKKLKELRDKVFDLCNRLGFWNVSPTVVANELGTAHQNISRWKQEYIIKEGTPNLERLGKELSLNGYSGLQELMKLAKNENKDIAVKALRTLYLAMEKHVEILEKMGLKPLADVAPSVIIEAKDKDLYNLLTPEQRKKLANLVTGKKEENQAG